MKHRCGNRHPERTVVCDSPSRNHPLCSGFDAAEEDYIDWPNPTYEPPKTSKANKKESQAKLSDIASRVRSEKPASGFAAGMEASSRAAGKWSEEEKQKVWDAIITVTRKYDEFTSDHIWDELNGAVPVTKGLASQLNKADHRQLIGNTGKKVVSTRKGEHGHAQTLSVWCSLIHNQ